MADKICTQCGHQGKSSKKAKGSFFVEAALWLVFLFIAFNAKNYALLLLPLVYTFYRMFASRDPKCPNCGAPNSMVPLDSPKGKELLEQYGASGS